MSDNMRRTTIVLAILSCAIVVACITVIYGVCTNSLSSPASSSAPAQGAGNEGLTTTPAQTAQNGAGNRQLPGIPLAMAIGMGLGCTVTYYLLHIRHVDSNISDMQRPLRR